MLYSQEGEQFHQLERRLFFGIFIVLCLSIIWKKEKSLTKSIIGSIE